MQAAASARAPPACGARYQSAAQRCRVAVRAASTGKSGSADLPAPDGSAGQPNSSATGFATATLLPGGALWWQHLHSSATIPLYGTNFVLQRPRVGGPGLVRAVWQPKPVQQAAAPPAAPPVLWHAPGAGAGLVLAGGCLGSGSLVIDTDFEVLPPVPAVKPNTACVGLVCQPSEGGNAEEEAEPPHSKHPRRTQALCFTCNLCGKVNDAAVNPHAWKKGSVFARCQGCSVVHKLRDNLNIFHELAGPVFPPRDLRANYLVQEILDRIQENNNRN